MNIQRFHAPTAREALILARQAFGDGTLILSNRPLGNGVEVMATAEESLATIARAPASAGAAKDGVSQDTEELAMSTLSFQSYVRERMLRRRQEEMGAAPRTATPARAQPAPAPKPKVMHADLIQSTPQVAVAAPSPRAAHAVPPTLSLSSQGIVDELQNMKDLIEERFNTMSWLGQARQDPIQSNLMLKMIRAGYSPPRSFRSPPSMGCMKSRSQYATRKPRKAKRSSTWKRTKAFRCRPRRRPRT